MRIVFESLEVDQDGGDHFVPVPGVVLVVLVVLLLLPETSATRDVIVIE